MNKFIKLASTVILCQAIGIISAFFTVESIPTWYAQLNKPSFSPPNWIFGPVWTILYLLMGISLYLIWTTKSKKKKNLDAIYLFSIQLALNFIWSPLFFGIKSPVMALVCILLMLIFIVLTIKAFYKINKNAAYLLIPYLCWVSFATILNFSIVLLN